jgi:hypothetical protein
MKVCLPRFSTILSLMLFASIAINAFAVEKEKWPVDAGKGEYVVGTGTFSAVDVPVYPWYEYSYTQSIYLQSELDFSGQMIEQIGYQYAGNDANLELEIEIWLEHYSQSSINSTVQLTNATKVYDGPWNLSAGEDWSMITIDPFVYNNSDNLLLTIIEKKPGYDSNSDAFYADFVTGDIALGNQNDGSPYDPNNLPASQVRVMRANTKFVTSDIPAGPAVSQITPTILDFGNVGLGMAKTLSVQIKNTGSDPLEVTGATSSNSQFAVINTTFPFTLGAAGSQNVEIEFIPVDETSETGTIEFLFDAGIAGDREVQVSGNGIVIMDVVVGTGTYESHNTPVYPYYGYSFTQTLYLQPELSFQDKQIYRIGYQYIGSTNNLEFDIEVWMKHTSASQITSTQQLDDFTKVYDGPWFVSPGGFSEIEIDPFIYNNTDNLIVTVIEKLPGWNSHSDKFYATQSDGQSLCRGAWNDGSAYDPENLPSGSAISWRPNTKFWFEDVPEGPAVSQITPTTLDFGELVFGETATLPVTVKNLGVDPLEITGYNSSNSHFTLVGATFPITLGYNQQQEFEVLFQPTTTDVETGTITFEMDPLIDGDKEVAVSGQMAELTITEFPWLEGFDDGLPEGWQNQVVQSSGWEFFNSPFSHTVIYNFPGSPNNAANLLTPLIDLSGLDNPRLGMNNMFYYYQSSLPIMAELRVSTDGITWETLHDFTTLVNNSNYNYEEYDLSAYTGQEIYLAFAVDFPENNTDFYEVVWEIEHVTIYNFIPTYVVTFTVDDPEGNILNDAVITLDGVTNAPGDYTFTGIQAGTYDYSVELAGYVTAVGEVTVTDEDVNMNITLNLPDLITEFPWFEGFDAGALPEGWQHVINEGNGWNFALAPYSHTYIYSLGGGPENAMLITPLLDLSGLNAATLEIYHRIYAYGTGWSNKILMSPDGANWETIAEFTEGFNPDINMYMEFEIPQQAKAYGQVYLAFAIDYPVLPDYYEVVWEIVDIEVFEPVLPAYNVNFIVEDSNGDALNDAIITLDGMTNDAGDYTFEEVIAGTYDYVVELDTYTTVAGQVTVVDEDITETVVLTQSVIITEFPWFEGFDGGELPEGWQNVANQGTEWAFALNPYSHTYNYVFGDTPKDVLLITPLLDLSSLETAVLGIFHRIYAYGEGWSHKILMSPDGINWETLAEFTEGFVPDENMYMEFEIPQQAKAFGQVYLAFAIDYPVLPDYYEVVWEIVDVTVFEPVETYDVTFVVEDEGGVPLADAVITFDGMTNAAGDYLFEEVEPGIYDYSVELDGYITADGQVEVVDQDVEVTVQLEIIGQLVEMTQGWSLISSYQNPESNALEDIFADQILNENLIIMLNGEGFFWPGQNINTLGDWNPYNGYKVKMNEPGFANIMGEMVEDKTVALSQGINYLPVLSEVPYDAMSIFQQIEDELLFAFDLVNELVYWPAGGLNMFEVLEPGMAYLVGMSAPGTVTFGEPDGKYFAEAHSAKVVDGPWEIKRTGNAHLVSIPVNAFENGLESGDIVAAFSNEAQCVGMVRYNGESNNLGLVVYGDDLTTQQVDGMPENESMQFRLRRMNTNETIDISPVWNKGMPNSGFFTENGLSAVLTFKYETFGTGTPEIASVNIYPNPAKEEVFVQINAFENARIEIIDQVGQIVMDQFVQQNESRLDVSNLRSGIYLVRITTNDQQRKTSKLIIK